MLWAGIWLAVVLVALKAVPLGVPDDWDWPLELMRVSWRDVIFALGLGAFGHLCTIALSRRPRLAGLARTSLLVFAAVCAFYAVIAYGVFNVLGRPLTFDLLKLVRGAAVKSSIADHLTWQIITAMLGVPGVYFLVARRWPKGRGFLPVVIPCLGLWIVTGSLVPPPGDRDMKLARLALNPHVELVRSTVVGIFGKDRGSLPREFIPGDQDELQPFGNRASAWQPGFQPPAGAARPRNVIVIVLESVGTKYMGLYGSRYATTPRLVEESKHALLFHNINAHAPYTFCSFMAVNFSIYPGVPWGLAPGALWTPEAGPGYEPTTLASVVKKQGWRTAYLHSGNFEWGGQDSMLEDRGYDVMEDYKSLNKSLETPALSSWGVEDRYLFDRLIQWIDEKPGQPFLAYCWTDQTHHPYKRSKDTPHVDFFKGNPPKALPKELDNYLNVLHETDGQIGRLFDTLRARGIADDTLVVITGDHGETFADPHDQRQHGYTVWQEELNVPFMVWNPRLFPEANGRRMPQVGGHVDLNPTVLDILGLEMPDAWQGHSLFDAARPNRTFCVACVDDYLFSVREDDWKYIFEMTTGRELLFNLATDPEEQRSIFSTEAERAKRFRQRIAAWIDFEDRFVAHQIAVGSKKAESRHAKAPEGGVPDSPAPLKN